MARVVVDVPLAHLDRPFDYAVPDKFADTVQAGCRVRVRFSGQLVDGFVLSSWTTPPTSPASSLPLVARARPASRCSPRRWPGWPASVADRYAGHDERRPAAGAAAPPRPRRRSGRRRPPTRCPGRPTRPGSRRYPAGPALLDRARRGAAGAGGLDRAAGGGLADPAGRAVPGGAVRAARGAGRRPRRQGPRPAGRRGRGRLLPEHSFTVLRADDSPEKRYRQFLAASRGAAQVVLGTRAAMFAPVRDLGLVVVWDDGDDLHADEHAPYPHARDVLVQRAWLDNCAAVVAGTARTAEAALLVESGWAHELVADRAVAARRPRPAIQALGDDFELARDPAARSARLPSLAHEAARRALAAGAPVLVQVPRRGYVPVAGLRPLPGPGPLRPLRRARWASRRGPGPGGARIPACRWCARPAATFDCPHCHGTKLRAAVVGESRTAEELARAFPGATVRTSGQHVGGARDGAGRPGARRRHARAPSRWPTAGTAPRCCWTPGRCSAGPTCGRGRRRCAAG